MPRTIVIVVTLAFGCEKEAPRFEGPMRVAFGDCAGANVSWISGPRPLPFTQEEAEAARLAADDTLAKRPAPAKPTAASTDPDELRRQAIEQARNMGYLGDPIEADFSSGFDDNDRPGFLVGEEPDKRSGFGSGGGGTGWGVIGIGRGRIGTTSGYGIPSGPSLVRIGQPSVQGDLDKAIIRRYVKRNVQKFQYCYEKQLLVIPTLAGAVATSFFIGDDGIVKTSQASGVDKAVADCVANVFKAIQFPKPKTAGGVQVLYPLTFTMPAKGAKAPAPVAPPVVADPPPPTPAPAPTPKPPPPKPQASAGAAALYQPGEKNPLRAEEAALEECFRSNNVAHGALVVDLAYDKAGTVTRAFAHGQGGDKMKECVVAAAKKAKRVGAEPALQRCSIAFGDMPLDALPTIAITRDAISFNDARLTTVSAALAEAKAFKIVPVFDRVTAEFQLPHPPQPIVSRGPLVIRPAFDLKMGIVNLVLMTVRAAGEDYIFASDRMPGRPAGQWQLLRRVEVPVVPVPIGTGGSWNRFKIKRLFDTDDRVELSVLVTKERIWVGVSRVNEFQEVAHGDWEKLAKVLEEHKQSAFFVDRSDLEIAGDSEVEYGDVVRAVDIATKAGFAYWAILDPEALKARPEL